MRIISTLRAATIALALSAALAPAFAGVPASDSAQAQQAQNANTGPYDGATDQAAKHAFY